MLCKNHKCGREIPDDSILCCYCGITLVRKKGKRRRANGMGSAYKRGKTWTAVYIKGSHLGLGKTGKEHKINEPVTKGGFATEREALEYCVVLKAQCAKEAAEIALSANDVKLSTMWATWQETERYERLASNTKTALRKAWGRLEPLYNKDIRLLTIAEMKKVIDDNGKSFDTRKDMRDVLSHCYKASDLKNFGLKNLAQSVPLPPAPVYDIPAFTEDEVDAFWKDYNAGNLFTGYILFLTYTGTMPGELFKIKKLMINWEDNSIVGAGLKTDERKNSPIVFPDFITPVLKSLCDYSKSRVDNILEMSRDKFYETFDATLERLGVRPLHPYSCRHTTATELSRKGVPVQVIKRIMRHAKLETTDKYIDKDTTEMRKAMNKTKPKMNKK